MTSPVIVRPLDPEDIVPLARLWHDGWQDGHAAIVPAEFARHRTLERFEARLPAGEGEAWVTGPAGAPLGFYLLKGDELNQFYVAAAARGTGVATALIADAEARLAGKGEAIAWLTCAIGNNRAARFYEKSGWRCAGKVTSIPDGQPVAIEVWRYEKPLGPGGDPAA
jgi:GNAT superfamily N-acetyltransferase